MSILNIVDIEKRDKNEGSQLNKNKKTGVANRLKRIIEKGEANGG